MSAMHPESGVPPEDARNSLPNDVEASVNCQELWYSTSRCQPRFDPAAANAMLAELITLINKGEVIYDCNHLDQVQYAVRYLIQRGLTRACLFTAGPTAFLSGLDPQCTRYNDFMTLTIIPNVDCGNGITLDLNNLGVRDILRNDGKPLEAGDLLAYKPEIIAYWNGAWYVCGLVRSQVPRMGSVDGWVRTDGNDTTGDGTENTPQKAFRTINGAYRTIGSKYAQSPTYVINIRLGIPGTYEAARIAYSGCTVVVTGDVNNPTAYRIQGFRYPNGKAYAFYVTDCTRVTVQGVTLLIDQGGFNAGLSNEGSLVVVRHTIFEQIAVGAQILGIEVGSGKLYMAGQLTFNGMGQAAALIYATNLSTVSDGGEMTPHRWTVSNVNFTTAGLISGFLSTIFWGASNPALSATTGPQYGVSANSILYANGAAIPGNAPGSVSTGGQFIP